MASQPQRGLLERALSTTGSRPRQRQRWQRSPEG